MKLPARLRRIFGRGWRDDVTLLSALVIGTAGLWAWVGPRALIFPGLVLLYCSIPTRRPFIANPPPIDPGPPGRQHRQ
jgi:hypothetical protein